MNIKMQYPIGNNTNFDGKIHDIKPLKLTHAKDSNFYILEYFDNSLGKRMYTFLKKEGYNYFKIPLERYPIVPLFKAYFKENCNLNILPEFIECKSFSTIENVIAEIKYSPKNNMRMATKKVIKIYYNEYDRKYYSDSLCTTEIEGAPESLGNLSNDGCTIIGYNIDYKIEHVYVKKNDNSKLRYKQKIIIFYNIFNKKYYWDKLCKNEIEGAPESLGELSNDDCTIIGHDIDYSIEYTFTVLLNIDKTPVRPEDEKINHLQKPATTIEYVLYDEEKKVFYYSEYISSSEGIEPSIRKNNMPGNKVKIQYSVPSDPRNMLLNIFHNQTSDNQNETWVEGEFIRIPETDIDNKNLKKELLRGCWKVKTKLLGKNGIYKIRVLKDQDGNKYIKTDKMMKSQYWESMKILLDDYTPINVVRYTTKLRLLLEKFFSAELVYEEQPISIIKLNDLDNSNRFRR